MIEINPQAFFFDFDGVICDSEKSHMIATLKATESHNIVFDKDYYFEHLIGFNDKEIFAYLFKRHNKELSAQTLKELIKNKNLKFMELIEKDLIYYDGVVDLIQRLYAKKIPMAIVSGALDVEITECLGRGDLNKYFRFIISAEKVQRGKPDPEGFDLAFDLMSTEVENLKRENCWVLEDSIAGLTAAKDAGLKTIGIPNTSPIRSLMIANHVVEKNSDIVIIN